jgi:hypothetical protein
MRYLVLTYYTKPDGKTDESATVVKNIKNRDLQTANVILDFKRLDVVKCSMGGINVPRDFHKIVQYYMQYYENIIKRLFAENGYQIETTETQVQPAEANPG